jgi:NitT/TauT family transport system substrate-binding protein
VALKQTSIIVVIFAIILALLLSFYIYMQQDNAAILEPLTVGVNKVESSLPFYIAYDQGFFENKGLNVTFIEYHTGLAAVNAMKNNEVDVAIGVTDYVFASKALNMQTVKTIGSFAQTDSHSLVTRKDLNINNVLDLAGKTIALQRGTVQEYYLGKFFEQNNLSLSNVTLINISTIYEGVGDLFDGQIDACIVTANYLDNIQAQLDDKVIIWSIQSYQPFFALILCDTEWINQHKSTIEHLLAAIDQAEQYMIQHLSETQKTIQEHLNYTNSQATNTLTRNTYILSLSPALITTLEDQSRWQISNKFTNATVVPNFLDYIYFDGLAEVKPDAITIVW